MREPRRVLANGVTKDKAAISAAITPSWSNGQIT